MHRWIKSFVFWLNFFFHHSISGLCFVCWQGVNSSIHIQLHKTITYKQYIKIVKLHCLRQRLTLNLADPFTNTAYLEDVMLIPGGQALKTPYHLLSVDDTVTSYLDLLLLHVEFLFMKPTNKIRVKGQLWQSPVHAGNQLNCPPML